MEPPGADTLTRGLGRRRRGPLVSPPLRLFNRTWSNQDLAPPASGGGLDESACSEVHIPWAAVAMPWAAFCSVLHFLVVLLLLPSPLVGMSPGAHLGRAWLSHSPR